MAVTGVELYINLYVLKNVVINAVEEISTILDKHDSSNITAAELYVLTLLFCPLLFVFFLLKIINTLIKPFKSYQCLDS